MTSLLRQILNAIVTAIENPNSPREIDASLDAMARDNPEKLDWRHSIVDLMKLVGMDSSVQARDELALELGYTGVLNGSAEMNQFMHDKLMREISYTGAR